DPAYALERGADHQHAVMRLAARTRAGVSGMAVAVIPDVQDDGGERLGQGQPGTVGPGSGLGRICHGVGIRSCELVAARIGTGSAPAEATSRSQDALPAPYRWLVTAPATSCRVPVFCRGTRTGGLGNTIEHAEPRDRHPPPERAPSAEDQRRR